MFKKLLNWLRAGQIVGLEAYINSKNPQNIAEVEYWQRQYGSNKL